MLLSVGLLSVGLMSVGFLSMGAYVRGLLFIVAFVLASVDKSLELAVCSKLTKSPVMLYCI